MNKAHSISPRILGCSPKQLSPKNYGLASNTLSEYYHSYGKKQGGSALCIQPFNQHTRSTTQQNGEFRQTAKAVLKKGANST